MTACVYTPLLPGRAIELGHQLWRKRVLPIGDVEYKGRLLHFTRDYLSGLVDAFRSRAYDAVPFQLADSQNTHTNDPERTRGEIVDMDASDDGLWVTARVTPQGERVLADNPALGVSARIVEDYARSDGQFFPAAIQHVLGTLDPRIPALGPWEAIEASNSGQALIDLSAGTWVEDDEAVYAQVLAELAEEGEGVGDDGDSHDDDETPDDEHFHGHPHVHASGLSHDHGHPHDHTERSHDQPGQTNSFANLATDSGHEHQHEHNHGMSGHHGHVHGHGHENARHLATHENLLPGGGTGGDAGQLAHEMANLDHAIELAAATERARAAQDHARPPRMAGEAKLADALTRVATGTYTPSRAAQALGLAGEASSAGRALAEARWQTEQADPGICGPPDAIGGCSSRFHDSTCSTGMLADPEVAGVLRDEGVFTDAARSPWADGNGHTWFNQTGMPMDITQHIEAATGQRVTPLHGEAGLFEDGTGQRETIAASRVPRYGNPDDEDDQGVDISRQTRAAARDAATAMGITIPNAANERVRYREAADAATAQLALRNGMKAPHPDFGETSRDRAARMHSYGQPVAFNDPVNGEQPTYTRGQI